MRPDMMRSLARAGPTSRASRWVPPAPGMMPRLISGWPSFASAAATRQSQARASSQPPPRAYPVIAATTGFGIRATASNALVSALGPDRHVHIGHVQHLLDVDPGREHLLAAVDDDRPDHRVGRGRLRGGAQLLLHGTLSAFIGGRSSRMVPMPSATSSRTNSPMASALFVVVGPSEHYARGGDRHRGGGNAQWSRRGVSIGVSMAVLFHENGLQITDDWIRTDSGIVPDPRCPAGPG